jgi:hypothetical protein
VTAWGSAPGKGHEFLEALKARNTNVSFENSCDYEGSSTFRTFSAKKIFNSSTWGRWPRLLHFAPLSLSPSFSHTPIALGSVNASDRPGLKLSEYLDSQNLQPSSLRYRYGSL